jgi:hypothetical protein
MLPLKSSTTAPAGADASDTRAAATARVRHQPLRKNAAAKIT